MSKFLIGDRVRYIGDDIPRVVTDSWEDVIGLWYELDDGYGADYGLGGGYEDELELAP